MIARLAGIFQLLEAITATFGLVIVTGRLTVAGNAAATAANIVGHENLFWLGFASSLLGVMAHVVWAVLLYTLLKPVNRILSLLAAAVILVGSAIQAVASLLYVAPLLILQNGSSLSAFTPQQLQALAFMFIKLNAYALNVHLVLFGFCCLIFGYVIFRSTFLPRVLGGLLAITGLAWMVYLYPPLAYRMFPVIAAASFLGEVPLELWLIVMGVNAQRWKDQASTAAS